MAEQVEETTAERLVRELRESHEGERIKVQFEQGIINPMELAKFIGVRPQQVYADIRAGKLRGVKDNNTQKLTIQRADAVEYAARYMDRKAARLLQTRQEAAFLTQAAS